MTTQPSTDIAYYYDSHPTKEDLMADSIPQFQLGTYLISVLRWYYAEQNCTVLGNINIYQTDNPHEYPLAPDVLVWIGRTLTEDEENLRSWRIRVPQRPMPTVVFEIGSEETWKKDLTEKPGEYARMGVREYFAYDPNIPPLRKRANVRLYGWRIREGQAVPMQYDERGWLWSEQLESWLIPNGKYLHIADRDATYRLTQEEAAKVEQHARREIANQLRVEQRAREAEQRARQEAERQFEVQRAELERMRVMLRERGIDPNVLS